MKRARGIIATNGTSLVDNAFAAPGANGCAGLLALLVDPAVDLIAGVPAAAGHNTAILEGGVQLAPPRLVKAEATLPQLGRCVKATGGAYADSACIGEAPGGHGEYEWTAGPGANPALLDERRVHAEHRRRSADPVQKLRWRG